MRILSLILLALPLVIIHGMPAQAQDDLPRLLQGADRCDADTSGIPDTDTCGGIYTALIRHYGGYPQFRAVTLERLHQIATRCDADTSGVPDADTCVPAYARLINAYGSYSAYLSAADARKPTN
jgi:hypothetical protein